MSDASASPTSCANCGYMAQTRTGKCPSCGAALGAPPPTAAPTPAPAEVTEAAGAQQVDPTQCCGCGASNGTQPFPTVGGLPWCPTCREGLYNRPFPGWLRVALAGLLVLLVYSYFHGAQYFQAGRALVAGERLLGQQKYAEAAPILQSVVETAPQCEKCILLAAKAQLLSGDIVGAYKGVSKHNDGTFEKGPLLTDVQQLFAQVDSANKKMEEAQDLVSQNKNAEAEAAIREAARIFPPYPGIEDSLTTTRAGAAFERKDYDEFLRIAEKAWQRNPESAQYAGQMASALACKYAVTGDESFRARSEEHLTKASQLAVTPEEKELWKEYEERIRHRLRTREIIEKEEYDRRYRPAEQGKKP